MRLKLEEIDNDIAVILRVKTIKRSSLAEVQ